MTRFASLWPTLFGRSLRREDGQTMAEYAVILAVITVVVVGTVMLLSGSIDDALTKVKCVLDDSGTDCT